MAMTMHRDNERFPLQELPPDYIERVYAGVLGKIIGVYLGRPFEGWTYERIAQELGEINYYVHDKLGVPLIVTDDDLSGTFTFVRALADYGNSPDLSAAQIGQTWLNYIIERHTILWWGGMGTSTEHTAYLRLKAGIQAPKSGSSKLNGQVVAEQIGAQIFIDGWGMVAPGDPVLAAELARKAGSVSHDGEAVYAAQVIAAMEAAAFVEHDLDTLLDIGLSFIPSTSLVARMIQDIRAWHQEDGDWRRTRERIVARYGYDRYSGGCHVIPNHALIILALLYGDDDFQQSLMIVNTCGWDTDCNSGNVGCLLAIKNGLQTLDAGPDWRGPVADRLYLPTADGGSCISDAVQVTYQLASVAHALRGLPFTLPPRFNFSLPGSLQGFQLGGEETNAILSNVVHPLNSTQRCLAVHYQGARETSLATPTFIPPSAQDMPGYELLASPTFYAGQIVEARLLADQANIAPISVQLFVRTYGTEDQLETYWGPIVALEPQAKQVMTWQIPDTTGEPIMEIGLTLRNEASGNPGRVYLESLDRRGAPITTLTRPARRGQMWHRAWTNAVDQFEPWAAESFRLVQNTGRGLLIQGTRDWQDYRISTTFTPHLAEAFGLAACVQGLQRYYALLLTRSGRAQLVKVLDGEHVLAETSFPWELYQPYALSLQVQGTHIQAWINEQPLFDLQDTENLLEGGAIALICQEGRIGCDTVSIQPATS
ncbi:hypothetical protein KSB_83080 [Ktedonobacter robiniae]|uniref:ADP-ribosylglycohydrolase family protein n=2 Tax=Ktedonobacter robiniae TaxID=2778365 RepID=A0ABQ3V4F6_9CHLR|nr:hypothetical protein KSB_83080 [Ktedonobacter robiniae]